MSNDIIGSDVLSDDDLKALEYSQEEILDLLYKKVRDSDAAKQWLNTTLGQSFRKFLAADKLRTMKNSASEQNPEALLEAQIEFKAICKLESIFGAIISDGHEAIQQLTQMHEGDTNG